MTAHAVLRHSSRDALLVAFAAGYGALVLRFPSAPLIAIGFWWIANTVAHNFIHLPFFRVRPANAAFSVYLSLLLGLPQTLWRDRHLAHHAGRAWRWRWSRQLAVEGACVALLWLLIASRGPALLLMCAAGCAGGLMLCALQGHFEHVRGTVSHYGRVYNGLFFNDGYHVEHHARPGVHWSALPAMAVSGAERSAWPPVLRWLELAPLDALERLALRSRRIREFMVDRHERAFRTLLRTIPPVHRVTVIGGGLFPRTALVMQQLVPSAEITVVDQSAENIARAMPHMPGQVRVIEATYGPEHGRGADLVIVPLAFNGSRASLYANPSVPAMAVHDWIWRRRGKSVVVSLFLLKRINLIRQ